MQKKPPYNHKLKIHSINNEPPTKHHYVMGIEYDGSNYHGWQRQSHAKTVQAEVESALSSIANEMIEINCAGRTDAQVHATCQIISFSTFAHREIGAWTLGVNSKLPEDIAVKFIKKTTPEFHARFCATARQYRYIIFNDRLKPAILSKGVTQCYEPLDEQKMHRAAQYLIGEHDFTSFRAITCQSNTPFRNVHAVSVHRLEKYVVIEIKANAFLHHMVRNIAGSLMEIGKNNQPELWLQELLLLKNRTLAAPTAKPYGLYLVDVDYPECFAIPKQPKGPLFIPDRL